MQVTSATGCSSDFSEAFTFYLTAAEDELPADKALVLYLNPTSGKLYLQRSVALAAATVQVSIINFSGSTVRRKEYARNTVNTIEIAMEHLPASLYLYLVQIATAARIITKKVLLRH